MTTLTDIGIDPGAVVRFQKVTGGRWLEGKALSMAKDGSVTLFDCNGRFRAIRPERLELRGRGPRGGVVWVPVLTEASA